MVLNYCNLKEKKCVHKKIFTDTPKEMLGLVCIVFGSALSNAGGIGGGGLLIPILLLILKFYTHEAIPISKLMIFTGALTSFILGFKQKHPTRNSISIDYNIPLLLVPMLLFGTMVGVTLNKVTPPWIILVSLTLILIINTYKTLKKGISLHKQENKNLENINSKNNSINEPKETRVEIGSSINDSKMFPDNENLNSFRYEKANFSTNKYELLKLEELKDLRKLPLNKLIYMFICYIVMLSVNFVKGSDHVESLIGIDVYY